MTAKNEKQKTLKALEGAAIGSIILKRDNLAKVKQILRDEFYFQTAAYQILYRALLEFDKIAECWDLLVIREFLRARDELEAVGGTQHLVELVDTLPTAENAEYYAKRVFAAYKRRRAAQAAQAIQHIAEKAHDSQALKELTGILNDLHELAEEEPMPAQDGVQELKDHIETIKAGCFTVLPSCWPLVDTLTRWLQPGSISIFCGTPGASKSFAALQLLDAPYAAAYFALEDNKRFHLARALAQKAGLPGLTDPAWIADNMELAAEALEYNAGWLKRIAQCITADGGGQVSYADVLNWMLAHARAGFRLLIIDPITAVEKKTKQPWEEDNKFIQTAKKIAGQYGCAVALISHPAKTSPLPVLENLSGGAAFSRFAQTVLWLEYHDPQTSQVVTASGTVEMEHNRTLYILKARLGKGQGARLAAQFGENLSLSVIGGIVKSQKQKKNV